MAATRSRLFDLPKAVWLLGWVSLATDAASEAIAGRKKRHALYGTLGTVFVVGILVALAWGLG